MFPDETHQEIVKRIDALESSAFTLYRQLESLRLELQRQWKVLPSGERWSEQRQRRAEQPWSADAVDPHVDSTGTLPTRDKESCL